MIWLNLRRLEKILAGGSISEKTGFDYLLTWVIFFAVVFYLPGSSSFTSEWLEIANLILSLLITVAGISIAFKINNDGANRDFLKRFISLAFVNGLRLSLLFLFLYIVYKIIMFIVPLDMYVYMDDLLTGDIPELLASLLFDLVFYLLIVRSFRRINSATYPASVV